MEWLGYEKLRTTHTFLLDMVTMNDRHCLCISRPGFWRFFRKSTKSLDTCSVSKLAWRLTEGLGVLASCVSGETVRETCKSRFCLKLHKAPKRFKQSEHWCCFNGLPFLGGVRDDGLKNFLTVVTFRVFSLVFFSSNLEKGPREACPVWGGVDWEWAWLCTPWLLAYAASSSRCNLKSGKMNMAAINKSAKSTS